MALASSYTDSAERVILVTGPSGAGRTTAINALEDAGFEAIDNLPLSLAPRLLDGPAPDRTLVLGLDTRNRDFSVASLIDTIDTLSQRPDVDLQVLYLDCASDVLVRRFSSTRRRHPMAPDASPRDGIQQELDLLTPIQARADVLIDTSSLTPHDLRAEVERWFAPASEDRLAITLQSFSYKRGIPRGLDVMFDCRFLRNPFWNLELKGSTGLDPSVQTYVAEDDRFDPFLRQVLELARLVIPAHAQEGRSHLAIGFGCSGGQHRSVTMVELLAKALESEAWRVTVRHRELERRLDRQDRPQQGKETA
ncbi:MAG: RNase adapter RapZ [Pseudomonadota bacterium]